MNPVQSASNVGYWKLQFLSNVRFFHVVFCSSVFTLHIRTADLTWHSGHMTLLINIDFKSNFNSHVIQSPEISVSLSVVSHFYNMFGVASTILLFYKGENQAQGSEIVWGISLQTQCFWTLEDKFVWSCIKQPFFFTFIVSSVSIMALASLFLRNLWWIIF